MHVHETGAFFACKFLRKRKEVNVKNQDNKNTIIRLQSEVIDELYAELSRRLSSEELEACVNYEKIKKITELKESSEREL